MIRRLLQAVFAVAVLALATGAALYLAGVFFLAASRMNPLKADLGTYYQYWYYYYADPRYQRRLQVTAALAAAIAYGVPLLMILGARKQPRPLHGSARFATGSEIAKAGLFAERGILLGQWGRRYLCLDGQTSVMLAAPPRAGKGVGVVIPNLLNWPDSVVVLDVRLEAFDATSGYRAECGQPVYLFNPLAEDRCTARWNPLDYISRDPALRISDIQRIATLLLPEQGPDPIWAIAGRDLFLGIVLYLLDTPSLPTTLGEVLRQLKTEQPTREYFQEILAARNDLAPPCRQSLANYCQRADREASAVRGELASALDLWTNPLLDAATSHNDFDLRELRCQRMSVYMGIPPSQQELLRPVIRLFFQQVVDLNTRVRPDADPSLRYQLLVLLDEFTLPGRMNAIAKGIAYLGGYNVRLLLVFQAPSQLRTEYGADTALTLQTSVAARIIYAQKEQTLAKEISDELGTETVKTRSVNRSRRGHGHSSSRGETTAEASRPLLLPHEVKELGQDKAIIVVEHVRPILAKKIVYYRDPVLKKRLRPPVEVSPIPPAVAPPPVPSKPPLKVVV